MRFYNREEKLKELKRIQQLAFEEKAIAALYYRNNMFVVESNVSTI